MFKIHTPINRLLQMCRLGILLLFLSSCVEEYVLPDEIAEQYTEQLYIEGKILSGTESIVYVMKTAGMNTGGIFNVPDAKVYVLAENGFRTENATYSTSGAYLIQTGELNDLTRYKLVVEYEGNIYESDYQYLQASQEIDEIGFTEDFDKGEVRIWVNTQGDNQHTSYYMWTFEEDFEYHSMFDMRVIRTSAGYLHYSKNYYPEVTDYVNPYYYCWIHRNSHQILIYGTDVLTENAVKQHVINKLTLDTPDLQTLYGITVYQSNLSPEAYAYYSQMKSNTEEMGSLFAPMPTEVYGNITCKNNPKIKVRGFVTASTTTMKRFFISASDLKQVKCQWRDGKMLTKPIFSEGYASSLISYLNNGYAVVSIDPSQITDSDVAYTAPCINCLLSGGTKDKPEWWPNDHE